MSTTVMNAALEFFKHSLSITAVVVTPSSEHYQESLRRWAQSSEKHAHEVSIGPHLTELLRAQSIVVFPATVEDVSKTVIFAQANNLEIAVKGGGHATSGSSSTHGGLCIDLDKMRKVTVNAEKRTVTVQGGALWADVDSESAKYSLACVGGTVNHTGVGGLTLGGGYGYLTGEHGLVIDNLLELQYVLADGSVVSASSTENPDLFWAARGAGAGFGVATSFTYRAHEQKNDIWGGTVTFPKSELENVINFANYSLSLPSGKHTVIIGFGNAPPPINAPVIKAVVAFNGHIADAMRFYAPLLKLPFIANTTRTMPYHEMNTVQNDDLPPGLRRTMKGSAFKPPLSITQAQSIFSDFETFIKEVPDAADSIVLVDFMRYHKLLEVQQTETSFANRGAYGNLTFAPGWTSAEFDAVCREWSREMGRKNREVFMNWLNKDDGIDSVTKYAVGEYVNHDGLNSSAEVLFGVNYPRLKELKRVYDPQNVFCKGLNLLA